MRFISTTTSTALEGYLFSSFSKVLDLKSRGLQFKFSLWVNCIFFYISSLSCYNISHYKRNVPKLTVIQSILFPLIPSKFKKKLCTTLKHPLSQQSYFRTMDIQWSRLYENLHTKAALISCLNRACDTNSTTSVIGQCFNKYLHHPIHRCLH